MSETELFEDKTWWEYRPAMLLVPVSSWVQIKSYIIKSCRKYGHCQDSISSWDRTIEVIDENLDLKLP